jgi:hypothetical protein
MSALLHMAHQRLQDPRLFHIDIRSRDQDREARAHHVLLRDIARDLDCDLGAAILPKFLKRLAGSERCASGSSTSLIGDSDERANCWNRKVAGIS